MDFRLVYRGQLRAATTSETRVREKHEIRKVLHRQLDQLWNTRSPFSRWRKQIVFAQNSPTGKDTTVLGVMANQHERFGYNFVPTVSETKSLGCELDILFLRRDHPGNLVASGGDIDNRMKTLFDALRMPKYQQEVSKFPVEENENPFFVLLEDDSQITKVSVSTDQLLTPPETGEHIHDVHLIIGVRIVTQGISLPSGISNVEFL